MTVMNCELPEVFDDIAHPELIMFEVRGEGLDRINNII